MQSIFTTRQLLLFVTAINLAVVRAVPTLHLRQDDDDDSLSPDLGDLSYIKNFAAVGDSFAAGIGAGIMDDSVCWRYYSAYPWIIEQDSRLGDSWHRNFQFLACSGHTTEQIRGQIMQLDSNVDAMTIHAGGNDVGLGTILDNCVYGWSKPAAGSCEKAIEASKSTIANVLPGLLDAMLLRARSKLRRNTGRAYYISYARFFGVDDKQCDTVSWSWHRDSITDNQVLWLTQDRRRKLNELVELTNAQIEAAVQRAGSQVLYLDVDQYYELWAGRFCESGVIEPDPNNDFLLFFNDGTEDEVFPFRRIRREDEPSMAELGVSNVTSFESQVDNYIKQGHSRHPWASSFDSNTLEAITDQIDLQKRGFIANSYRIFHPRQNGHAIIAEYVLYHMERERAKMLGATNLAPEHQTISSCPIKESHPSLRPGCAKNSVARVPSILKTPDGDTEWDPNGLLILLRQQSCTNECSFPPNIPAGMVSIYQDADKNECEISVALPENVEAWAYRGTPSTGSQWQDCWDSFMNITAQCVEQGPNNGWVNGPDEYEYFQTGFRPINDPSAKHDPLDPSYHLVDPNPPDPNTDR